MNPSHYGGVLRGIIADMSQLPIKKFIKHLVALLLIVTLSACIGTRRELFAPELKKSYVLTENLVQTSLEVPLPGWFQPRQNVSYVLTHEKYPFLKWLIDPTPLPNFGEVTRGTLVQVEQVFTYDDFNGDTRYGKLQFTDMTTGEQLTAYSDLDDVGSKLREIE